MFGLELEFRFKKEESWSIIKPLLPRCKTIQALKILCPLTRSPRTLGRGQMRYIRAENSF